jgi:hypothetical protein
MIKKILRIAFLVFMAILSLVTWLYFSTQIYDEFHFGVALSLLAGFICLVSMAIFGILLGRLMDWLFDR